MFVHQTKIYLVTTGIFLFLFCFGITGFAAEAIEQDTNALEQMKIEIAKMESVKEVKIQFGIHGQIYDSSGKDLPKMKNYMAVGVILEIPPTAKMEVKIAKIILEKYSLAEKYDTLSVQLIPINSMYYNYHASPGQWKEKISELEKDS